MDKTYEDGIAEGQRRALYLLLCIGDEYAAHDNWEPDKAQFLFETRRRVARALRTGVYITPLHWPPEIKQPWPDFEIYTWTPG